MQRMLMIAAFILGGLLLAAGTSSTALRASDTSDETPWNIDEPMERVPEEALSGRLFGHEFAGTEAIEARFNDQTITIALKERIGTWPAASLTLFINEDRHGEDIVITPMDHGMLPHIHLRVGMEGRQFPGTLMYTEMYSMRLHTERVDQSTLRGTIHLSLPDHTKSYIVGRFIARRQ